MNNEEFEKFVEESKAQGYTEEDILGTILQMFKDGKITLEDMKKMSGALGYELTEKFLELTEGVERMPSPESKVIEEDKGVLDEEEVLDAQEADESEDEDEDEEEEEEESEEESEDEDEDEDEEEKETVKRWFRE